MERLALLFLLPIAAHAQTITSQTVITAGMGMIPNTYCDDGTSKWSERGYSCHPSASDRQSVVCGYVDADGTIVSDPTPGLKCQVPAGWESAPARWQAPHQR